MKELLQKILTYEEYSSIPTVPFNRDIEKAHASHQHRLCNSILFSF